MPAAMKAGKYKLRPRVCFVWAIRAVDVFITERKPGSVREFVMAVKLDDVLIQPGNMVVKARLVL
jgi:hypothetical protein